MSFLQLLPFRIPSEADCGPPSSTLPDGTSLAQGSASLTRHGVDASRVVELREHCRQLLCRMLEGDEGIVADAAGASDADAEAELLACLQRYQSALHQLVERDVPAGPRVAFGWKWGRNLSDGTAAFSDDNDDDNEGFVWGYGWEWERRNVVLNVLILQARQASTILGSLASPKTNASTSTPQKKPNVSLLQRGIVALQNAATLAHHMADACVVSDDSDDEGGGTRIDRRSMPTDLSEEYWGWLEQYLLGETQRHVVAMFGALNRPPAMLAKMSAACTPLYRGAVRRANRRRDNNYGDGDDDDDSRTTLWPEREVCVDVATAWGMHHDSASEYHQAVAHLEKKEWVAAATRLVAALRYNTLCLDFCDGTSAPIVSTECRTQTQALMQSIQDRLQVLQAQQVAILDEDLPEIQPQSQAKLVPDCIPRLLPTVEFDPPLIGTPPSTPSPSPSPPTVEEGLERETHGAGIADGEGEPSVPPGSATPNRMSLNPRPSTPPSNRYRDYPPPAPQSPPPSAHLPPQHGRTPPAGSAAAASSPPPATRRSYSPPTPEQVLDWRDQQHMIVDDLAQRVANRADEARRALGLVGLPHSVAAYRQRHGGGGIPLDLWRRVDEVQHTNRDEALKSQLWQLRDDSDKAQHVFLSIQGQLEEDLALDRMFREQYGDYFVGHNVHEVQVHFRRVLDDYSRLMASAQESDRVLAEKLQILETDPKFRLLKFRKEQLDHLLPASGSRRRPTGDDDGKKEDHDEDDGPEPIDVSELSECLVTLSELIDQRDAQVVALQDFIDRVTADLQGVAADDEDVEEDDDDDDDDENEMGNRDGGDGYGRGGGGGGGNGGLVVVAGGERTMEAATRHIRDQGLLVQQSLQEQNALIHHILRLNEAFLSAQRDTEEDLGGMGVATSAAAMESSTNVLEKLGDALEELDQFTSHLQEGTAFYKVIIPKLEKLQHNVGDVSARLAVERYEFEDKIRRSRQEEEDARVASEMSSNPHQMASGPAASSASQASGGGGGGPGGGSAVPPSSMYAPVPAPAPQSQPQPPQPQQGPPPPPPRVEQYSHADGPPVRVDDSKVASLIELGFDPERAASALRRYHNDMDQAINDLLG